MLRRSWVNGVDEFVKAPWVEPFRLVQNHGRGLVIQGNRDWRDIEVQADVLTHLATSAGIAVRVQGMQRYYALLLHRQGQIQLVKVVGKETVLASSSFDWQFGASYNLQLAVVGSTLRARVDGETVLTATDNELSCGGMALVIEEGRTATNQIAVRPAQAPSQKES